MSVESIRPYFPSSQSLRAMAKTRDTAALSLEERLSVAGTLMDHFLNQDNAITRAITRLTFSQKQELENTVCDAKDIHRSGFAAAYSTQAADKLLARIKIFFDEAQWEMNSAAAKENPALLPSQKIVRAASSFLETEKNRDKQDATSASLHFYAQDPFVVLDVSDEILSFILSNMKTSNRLHAPLQKYCGDNKKILNDRSSLHNATPVQLEKACQQLAVMPEILGPALIHEAGKSPVFPNIHDNSKVLFVLSKYTLAFMPDANAMTASNGKASNIIRPDKFHARAETRSTALVKFTPSF